MAAIQKSQADDVARAQQRNGRERSRTIRPGWIPVFPMGMPLPQAAREAPEGDGAVFDAMQNVTQPDKFPTRRRRATITRRPSALQDSLP
jgi:hypothetical protein